MIEVADCEIVVKRCLEAVAEVRRFVRLTVGRWGVDDHVPCLVASELVTNAVRHGTSSTGGEVTVRLSRVEGRSMWLEVQDSGCDLPYVRDVDATSESGRGLFIVDQLTMHWGVRPLAGGGGKVVFALFEP